MIGDVPEGWKILPLKKLLNIQSGFAFDSKNFSKDKGKQLIRIRDLKNGFTTDVLFNGDYHNDYIVKSGSYLIGMDGDFICYEWKGIDSLLNQRVCRLHNFDSSINQKFIYYGINKELKKIHDVTSFVTVKHLSIKKINEIEFLVPPLPQQEKIVKVLDISSELIEKQKGLIAKYDLFLRSKFIEMFGDPIKNPMGWEVEKLKKSMIDVKNGLTRRGKTNSGEIVLKLKDIRENYIRFENLNRIQLDEKEKDKFIAKKGDLLFIRVNGNPDYVGRCSVFYGYSEAIYFNDHIMRIKVDNEIYNSVFLGYIVNSPYGKKQILKYRKTSAGQHTISQDGLERLSFYLPPINLQNKFAKIVEKIETIKTKESKKLEELETLHSSLMDKAFKGEIA